MIDLFILPEGGSTANFGPSLIGIFAVSQDLFITHRVFGGVHDKIRNAKLNFTSLLATLLILF